MMTGQLAKVRDALASEVAVVIDDRDQMALADQEAENEGEQSQIPGLEWSVFKLPKGYGPFMILIKP